MSVDVSAHIGYGYILTNQEYSKYLNKLDTIDDSNYMTVEDNCSYIDSYTDSDVFCGIIIDSTSYYTPLSTELIDSIDNQAWEKFYNLFKKEFPDIEERENPQLYLICQWW